MFKTQNNSEQFRTIWNIYDGNFCKNGCLAHFSASALKKFPWKNLQKILLWKNFIYFLNRELFLYSLKKCLLIFQSVSTKTCSETFSYIFWKKPQFVEMETSKKFLYFRKQNLLILQEVIFQDQKLFILFHIKKQKFLNENTFL